MSDHNSHHLDDNQAKVIQIKPLNIIKKEETNIEHSTDRLMNIQMKNELQHTREEILSLKKRKETLLQEMNEEITQQRKNWENEKKDLIKQAHDEGYQNGFKLGEQESINQYTELINNANRMIDQATMDYHMTLEQSEEMIVTLAIHIAEKIIQQKITENPEIFLPIVSTAIKELKDQTKVSIYLHPVNYEFVLQQKQELVDLLDGDAKLSLYIDQDLKENDCMIEHPLGQIDASVDTQLHQIRNALQELVMEKKQ